MKLEMVLKGRNTITLKLTARPLTEDIGGELWDEVAEGVVQLAGHKDLVGLEGQ